MLFKWLALLWSIFKDPKRPKFCVFYILCASGDIPRTLKSRLTKDLDAFLCGSCLEVTSIIWSAWIHNFPWQTEGSHGHPIAPKPRRCSMVTLKCFEANSMRFFANSASRLQRDLRWQNEGNQREYFTAEDCFMGIHLCIISMIYALDMTAKGASSSCIRRLKWSSNWFSQNTIRLITNTFKSHSNHNLENLLLNLGSAIWLCFTSNPAAACDVQPTSQPNAALAGRIQEDIQIAFIDIVFMSSSQATYLELQTTMKYMLSVAACIYVIH